MRFNSTRHRLILTLIKISLDHDHLLYCLLEAEKFLSVFQGESNTRRWWRRWKMIKINFLNLLVERKQIPEEDDKKGNFFFKDCNNNKAHTLPHPLWRNPSWAGIRSANFSRGVSKKNLGGVLDQFTILDSMPARQRWSMWIDFTYYLQHSIKSWAKSKESESLPGATPSTFCHAILLKLKTSHMHWQPHATDSKTLFFLHFGKT